MTNDNKALLQTSAGAAQLYNQALTNLSAIMTNANLNTGQQTTALNNGVKELQDGLAVLNGIANNQAVTSLLVFGNTEAPPAAAGATPTAAADNATPQQQQSPFGAFGG